MHCAAIVKADSNRSESFMCSCRSYLADVSLGQGLIDLHTVLEGSCISWDDSSIFPEFDKT
jgi:hypothetical protein